jgi:WD40 repeat protein
MIPDDVLLLAGVGLDVVEFPVRTLAFSADGQRLAGATERGEVYVWDLPTKTLLAARDATDGWTWPVNALAFSPNRRSLAAGGAGGRVRLWDTTTNRDVLLPLGASGTVRALAFAPDGRLLAVGMVQGNAVTLWDVPADLPEK